LTELCTKPRLDIEQGTQLRLAPGLSPDEIHTETPPPAFARGILEDRVPIDEVMGLYRPEKNVIEIYHVGIEHATRQLRRRALAVRSQNVEEVVRYHEWAHAMLHAGRDGSRNSRVTGKAEPDGLEEILAQLWVYLSLNIALDKASSREDKKRYLQVLDAFNCLSHIVPPDYLLWKGYVEEDVDTLQDIASKAREGRILSKIDLDRALGRPTG
jgi:hypothetical protein